MTASLRRKAEQAACDLMDELQDQCQALRTKEQDITSIADAIERVAKAFGSRAIIEHQALMGYGTNDTYRAAAIAAAEKGEP